MRESHEYGYNAHNPLKPPIIMSILVENINKNQVIYAKSYPARKKKNNKNNHN